ncbi:MFS transporter [Mycoplasma feriruminatoris]|uniref:Inner membrane protein YihN n=1 Tax=Mycoplasma feriruminatoris TaxID=1179777 RepID=A0A654ILW3_9MOLU|nr:MFS transporter [Mycoplasma feriruminatoris]WFQ92366.1 Inner membrane protein YihN [Mycoplasma feriruminatoris]WFQ95719.1 membrane protein [Mycoplasma feriruminatoris]VZR97073.1 Inner membrane protein YihN [Mycoplasma feriruminatoris]VZR99568.1 Inner membrane protein YihN [Mycoplasma feriruminatoris]
MFKEKISKFVKENFVLFILALADVAIMAIPFYMDNFIPNMNLNFKLNQADYSQAQAVYGFVALPCYLLGSYLGDKFSAKKLVIIGVLITGALGVWYVLVPIIPILAGNKSATLEGSLLVATKAQLYIIFGGFAFATCALFWAPLWKLVKNQNTEHLPEELKEKQVGKNNGMQGALNGLIGLTIALFGTLLLALQDQHKLGTIGGEHGISVAFFILISIYAGLIIVSAVLAMIFIKEPKTEEPLSFSIKAMTNVLKQKNIYLLSILVLGVYMLQMGLSSYVNYMRNIFYVPAVAVMIIGIFRTYVMRFMISGWFGRFADKQKSYIPLILIGLFIGMVLITVGILLPGFSDGYPNEESIKKASGVVLQVAACFNLILMGAVTWAVVTIRWSPIGTDLKVQNDSYAAAVNIVSVIAFTPDAFFKQIRSAIEAKHHMTVNGIQVADKLGNQLILLVVVIFGLIGLLSGIALYFSLKADKKKMMLLNK